MKGYFQGCSGTVQVKQESVDEVEEPFEVSPPVNLHIPQGITFTGDDDDSEVSGEEEEGAEHQREEEANQEENGNGVG